MSVCYSKDTHMFFHGGYSFNKFFDDGTIIGPKEIWVLTCDEGEKCLGSQTPYLAAIGEIMNLANCYRLDIAFVIDLLAKFVAKPTKW